MPATPFAASGAGTQAQGHDDVPERHDMPLAVGAKHVRPFAVQARPATPVCW